MFLKCTAMSLSRIYLKMTQFPMQSMEKECSPKSPKVKPISFIRINQSITNLCGAFTLDLFMRLDVLYVTHGATTQVYNYCLKLKTKIY